MNASGDVSDVASSGPADPGNGIGERLRRRRLAAGLTQEELSARSGLSVRSISDLERGRTRRPRRETMRRVADALNLPAADRYGTGRWHTQAQLPADLADFTGRDEQVRQLTGLLAGGDQRQMQGPVVISAVAGTAGVGKTALALHVAHQVAAQFPDGQLYLNLHGSRPQMMTTADALARLLRDLGVEPAAVPDEEAERAARFRSLVSSRRVLLVLDDARDASHVRPLLPGASGCAVLVTSRHSLLDLESARLTYLDVLAEQEATALFARIVGPERTAAEPAAVSRVLAACGALPLAIRIAAARLAARPNWRIKALADRLDDAQKRLDELRAGDLAVRTSFMVTYVGLRQRHTRTLDAPDRAFRLLGLADGPDISLPAVAALLGVSDDQAERVLELLVDANLLQSAAPGRYRFHDLLKVFSGERAKAEEDTAGRRDAIRRMLSWYLRTADTAARLLNPVRTHADPGASDPDITSLKFADYDEALAWLDTEHVNLVAAVSLAAREGEHEIAWKLPGTLLDLFALRYHVSDWIATHQTGLASARSLGNWRAEMMLLNNLSGAYLNSGRGAEAIDIVWQTIPVLREKGDPDELAKSLANLGFALADIGSLDEAAQTFQESLGLLRQSDGGDRHVAVVLAGIGVVAHKRGDLSDAIRWYNQAIDVARAVNDQASQIELTMLLSSARLELEDLEGAYQDAMAANGLSRQAGARLWEARSLAVLGRVQRDRGSSEQARQHWLQALAIFTDLGTSNREAEQIAAELRALGGDGTAGP
jgi:transcriptional regulator with XRE-family HTH domain/tetratricopeptide (TPR) repeat protein